ncbi:hypothetical protein GJ633_14405 [Halorubrum sp. CBA1125]|uniref:hypothetical protein n=1 Tax=Halorubrum sp. CBA1125 TaxID=2668072 RepID=UPI00135D573F|nr:hypothetical protein [Halorubrum sp. CBA1125]MUW15688.1 hypothetical protein [Halorubrum sp. CBA1125]
MGDDPATGEEGASEAGGQRGSKTGDSPPGVPATRRARARSAALWGFVGGFAFLVCAQGFLLTVGDLPVGYGGLAVFAVAITVASGGIAYATEHRLRAKRRT